MIIREGWSMSDSTKDVKERLAALSLVMEAYDKRINLLTNSQIVNKAAERVLNMKKEIEDIQQHQQQQMTDNNKEEDNDDNINNINPMYPYHESTVVKGETVKQKVMRINGYTTEDQYQQAKKDDIICNYTEEQENELVENLPHRDIDSDSNWLNSKHPQSQRKF
jgi:glucan phosphoethanolaminetransferase (alkaline phosphatase superfamily)